MTRRISKETKRTAMFQRVRVKEPKNRSPRLRRILELDSLSISTLRFRHGPMQGSTTIRRRLQR